MSPSQLAAEQRLRTTAERVLARVADAEAAALGEPPAGVAAVAPEVRTIEERRVLAEYVLGVVQRAGLAGAFRALGVNDAVECRDARLCALVGAVLTAEPGQTSRRWQPPAGTPVVALPEPVARELARRLVARATHAAARPEAVRARGVR